MADSSQLKRVDSVDFGDDDPFAELTKIMGFDPRVPVRPGASAAPVSPQATEPGAAVRPMPEPELDLSAEDFSIDLERELLGDFALDDEPAEAVVAAAPSAAVAEPIFEPAAPAGDDDLDLDLDVAFADLEDELSLGRAEPAGAEAPDRERIGEPERAALGDDVDFDAAFAADLEGELSLDPTEPAVAEAPVAERMGEPEHAALADEVDFDAAFEQDFAADEEPVGFDEPVRLDETKYGDAGQSADGELSAEDVELIAALEPAIMAEQFEDDRAPEQAEAPRVPTANAVDPDFDIAMADVDMDFSADSDGEHGRVESYQAASRPAGSEQAEPLQPGEIDFDDFDDALFGKETEPAAVEAVEDSPLVYVPAARAPVVESTGVLADNAAADEHDPEELSLEDELNALLGNSVPRAELTRGYDAPPLSASLPEEETSSADDFVDVEADLAAWDPDAPIAEDEGGAAPAAATYAPAFEAAVVDAGTDDAEEDEEDYAGPSYQVAEAAYGEDEYREDGYREDGQEPAFLDAQAAPEPGEEDELDFDDSAFHAAFENSLASGEPEESAAEEDPYAALRQMTSQVTASAYEHAAPLAPASDWQPTAAAIDEDIPDIDTVDVPESAMALADDLDIPELAYEDEVRAAPAYDEFESDFAAVYPDQPQPEEASPRPVDAGSYAQVDRGYGQRYGGAGTAEADAGHLYAAGVAGAAAGAAHAYASAATPVDRSDFDPDNELDGAELPGSRKPDTREAFDALDYDDLDEEIALPDYAEQRPEPQRRGLLIAAIVGGVAVLGGVGALALSFGGGGSGVPAIVRADDSPIKVRPENPGGTSVPNQDNKVYETVAGGKGPAAPAQEKLISSAEEPVDMAAKAPAPTPETATDTDASAATAPLADERVVDLPTGDDEIAAIAAKGEDRVAPSLDAEQPGTDNTEVAAVAPRRVRTMVVRPDGTLVPREDPAPAAALEPQGAAEAMMETAPAKSAAEPQVTNTTKPAFQAPGAEPVPVEAVVPAKPAKGAPPRAEASGTPASVPLVPSRPAEQPVDVVGEVKPEKVASVTQGAAAAGAWSVQIASQPSEDAAKSTYSDLARRYASVIGGRGATIVKAEIAGKGTFWRVRVPAGSRNEAVSLCESYKSAGGNCFVSK